jgi:hypothetical protein
MEQGPKVPIAAQYNVSASSAITTVRATVGCKLISAKMLDACTAMSATTKNSYLVYKIALLQGIVFALQR